jgi:hypothetical protein
VVSGWVQAATQSNQRKKKRQNKKINKGIKREMMNERQRVGAKEKNGRMKERIHETKRDK